MYYADYCKAYCEAISSPELSKEICIRQLVFPKISYF